MASDQLSAGLDYLTDAAHLLRQTAPETSAHLMLQRNELMFHNHLAQHEVQRQHVCGACGHIMIPGDNTALMLEARQPPNIRKRIASKKGKEQSKSVASGSKGPTKTITCGHCGRVTKVNLPPPEAVTRRRTPRASVIKKTLQVETQNQKTTANASSKKRAKNRKGGLQALLSGQQQKSTNSLSLADFMR